MIDIARALRLRKSGMIPEYDDHLDYECEELKSICSDFGMAKELIDKAFQLLHEIDDALEALAKERGIEIPKDECNDD